MKRDTNTTSGSSIYEQIERARMTDVDRRVALNALRQADVIVDALMWIANKIGRVGARAFLKPSLKH